MTGPPHVPQPETELEEFFDLSIDPMSIIGFDGAFKRVNGSFLRLMGYSKSELFSRSALDIVHPDDVEPAREALAHLAEGHDVVRFEGRVICADGAVRWLEWSTRSMPGRGVVCCIGRDTTERRRVEAELREAQRSLEASRDELRVLAEEQAALRRVATLVARDVPSRELFCAVARELGTLFGVDFSGMIRYGDDASVTTVATWAAAGEHPPVPTRWDMEPGDAPTIIEATREAARVADWTSVPGAMAAFIRDELGVSSSVGCPIVVEGRLWGALAVHSKQSRPLPPDTESRIAQFTDLIGTAIANAESRGRADRLAEEQAALRRLATLVAQEAPLEEVFAKVAEEVARTLGDVDSALWRDDGDRTVTAVAVRGPGVAPGVRVGTRLTLDGDSVIARVLREGQPHRIDDFSQIAGTVAERARELGMRSAVGCPIVVGSRTWGAMTVATHGAEPFAAETETRVARFSDLVATAIANSETRAEVERLAAEQAALRRVATLVARERPEGEVLAVVAEEVTRLFGGQATQINRYEPDGTATSVAAVGSATPIGTRITLDDDGTATRVYRTGRPARIDAYSEVDGWFAEQARRSGIESVVAVPIMVDRHLWGVVICGSRESGGFPADCESRLAEFAALVATAISGLEARAELAASRARIAAAADDERRRVARDLHDGAQQRLVHTVITLKLAQQALAKGAENGPLLVQEAIGHAEKAAAEVRELAHGILPSVLTHGGLRAGIDALGSRAPVPVEIDVSVDRLPAPVEATAYFVVAEALTNLAKHSSAGHAEVVARIEHGMLRVEVRDDGVGGASPDGTGLVGLADRLSVLDGRLEVDSPPGGGTRLSATIPLSSAQRPATPIRGR